MPKRPRSPDVISISDESSEDDRIHEHKPIVVDVDSSDETSDTVTSSSPEEVPTAMDSRTLMRERMRRAAEKRLHEGTAKAAKIPGPPAKLQKIFHTPPGKTTARSPIRMIANPDYCKEFCPGGDRDCVSLGDMVGSKDIRRMYQFNFLIDVDFLLKYVKALPRDLTITVINSVSNLNYTDKSKALGYKVHSVDMSDRLLRYGSHHTKMMINFFADGTCQIVVHTMNITDADYKIQTQMCWISPRLHKKPIGQPIKESDSKFGEDLLTYLQHYDKPEIDGLIANLKQYDFSDINVQFIGSVPGSYKIPTDITTKYDPKFNGVFGYGKLYTYLKMFHLDTSTGKLVGQCSTIAGPCTSKDNIFNAVLTRVAEGRRPLLEPNEKEGLEPVIVYPTVGEVLTARASYISGVALHFNSERKNKYWGYKNQYEHIKQYFYRWRSCQNSKMSKAGRSNLSPHVKTYCVTRNNFKTMEWFLMTSANMSSQAWGKPTGKRATTKNPGDSYVVSSYEAGILINPKLLGSKKMVKLVPVMGRDTLDETLVTGDHILQPVRIPYDIPLEKYHPNDKPWTTEVCDEIMASQGMAGLQ